MKKRHILQTIKKYAEYQHNKDIQKKFGKWFFNSKNEEIKEESLENIWYNTNPNADESTLEALNKLNKELDRLEGKTKKKRQLRTIFTRIAAVALIVLISSISIYYITSNTMSQNNMVEHFVGDGDQQQITLTDGTKVWINSGSLLIYPETFEGNTRTVFLNGEANFDVAKNKEKPFIVKTSNLDIEALGTVFNVKAYSELSKITATLEEGSIRVGTKDKAESLILKPNEQIVYDSRTNEMKKNTVDAERISSWKDGYLVFQEAELNEVLHTISRKYNVLIKYDVQKHRGQTLTIRFSQGETLNQTLDILKEIMNNFDYKIEDKTVIIY